MNEAPVVGGVAFALIALYMFRRASHNYRKALDSRHWPNLCGTLVDVHLWGKRNVGGQMKAVEKLSVKYEYKVEENVYSGSSVAFFTLHHLETTAFADNHLPDSDVMVYYNPRNAAEPVLVPGPKKEKPYSELIIGSCGIMVGAAVAVMGWIGVIG